MYRHALPPGFVLKKDKKKEEKEEEISLEELIENEVRMDRWRRAESLLSDLRLIESGKQMTAIQSPLHNTGFALAPGSHQARVCRHHGSPVFNWVCTNDKEMYLPK